MVMNLFEYIGSAFILSATVTRALVPNRIVLSFIFSAIGSLLLAIYSYITGQYGFLLLNFTSIIMAGLGVHNWLRVKLVEKRVNKRGKR